LHIAVDFGDDLVYAGAPYTRQNLVDLMAYYRSLGATRVYWIHNSPWGDLVRPVTPRQELLPLACRLAQEAGLEFYALYKPFETGVMMTFIPKGMPWLRTAPGFETIAGFHPLALPFVLEHPNMIDPPTSAGKTFACGSARSTGGSGPAGTPGGFSGASRSAGVEKWAS
jgi:hypothetical protein